MSNSVPQIPCGRIGDTESPIGADNASPALSSPHLAATAVPFEPSTEIMQLILDAVDDPSSSDTKATWKTCALVSARWRSVSQAYLLRDIQVGDNMLEACHFFETRPWLAAHVRRLKTVPKVDIRVEDLERLSCSLAQLRALYLRRTNILGTDEALQQEHRPGHHHLDLLECDSFGMGAGQPKLGDFYGLLSIFSDIKEIRIIDLSRMNGDDINYECDATAKARQPAVPTIQSILLRGFPMADFVIPTAIFLDEIGALRCLRELVIDARTNFSLIGISEVLCSVGATLERLSIHLETIRVESDPCDGFLPVKLRAGLAACSSLREFHLHLQLSYADPDNLSVTSEEALGLYWSMAADAVALIPVSHLRQLHLKFVYFDYTDSEEEWHDMHSLSWNKMREVCDAFPCLESLGVSITQPLNLKDPARHRRLQDCVKYEMREYRGVLVEEEEPEYAYTVAGCEDDGCMRYNDSLTRDL